MSGPENWWNSGSLDAGNMIEENGDDDDDGDFDDGYSS
jgi:hypothetical protein